MQVAIIKAGAVPALVQLLELAQPDGQYAAAAALYNLAGQEAEVRLGIVACKALPALVLMLQAESWCALPLLHYYYIHSSTIELACPCSRPNWESVGHSSS